MQSEPYVIFLISHPHAINFLHHFIIVFSDNLLIYLPIYLFTYFPYLFVYFYLPYLISGILFGVV